MSERIDIPFKLRNNRSHPYFYAMICLGENMYTEGYQCIVDTGSVMNYLNPHILEWLPEGSRCEELPAITTTTTTGTSKAVPYLVTFWTGFEYFRDVFFVCEQYSELMWPEDSRVMGILGVRFLTRLGLVLDFEKHSIYTSKHRSIPQPSRCDYVFDIRKSIEDNHRPFIPCFGDNNMLPCLLDSGGENRATYKAINMLDVDGHCSGCQGLFVGPIGTEEFDDWHLCFNACSYAGPNRSFAIVQLEASFGVVERNKVAGDHEIAIGGETMNDEKMVLDFKVMAVYRRKSTRDQERQACRQMADVAKHQGWKISRLK